MILVDTSVWIDHLRQGNRHLEAMLSRRQVLAHPHVVGEIALGSIRNHDQVVTALTELPQATVADDAEVLFLIRKHALMGSGIGYVDAHLLASTMLTPEARLWSHDKRLANVAKALGVGFTP